MATEVSSFVPELADVIIEYNRYLLHGDLRRKKEILKRIADAIEPRRSEFKAACNTETDDFFFMINNMDIRHNNCDPSDAKHYRLAFAQLSNEDKESWYDEIYEQALILFVLNEQQNRTKKISDFKKMISS